MNCDALYEKRGRRYYPVAQRYDVDVLPFGSWLVVCEPSRKSMQRLVRPATPEVEAAMRIAANAMVDAMFKASELQPTQQRTQITSEQRRLLDELAATGFNASLWQRNSLHDIVQAGIDALCASIDGDTQEP